MKTLKLLCLVCSLGGCTLTLTGETDDGLYPYDEELPVARPWHAEADPLPEPTFVPVAQPAIPAPEPLPPADALRDLSIDMSDMYEEMHRFMKFRIVSKDDEYVAVGVIHQGITTPDYRFDLPDSLRVDTAYRLDFYADADDSGGYSPPPDDHAWSIPIPAGDDDVVIEFDHNDGYVDIERDAPKPALALILTSREMQEYYKQPLDVRVFETDTGRLVGRQLRSVPGDRFDLTIGGVIQQGVDYHVDIAIDMDRSGDYDRIIDDSWRLAGTATSKGLQLEFEPNDRWVDVGF